MTLISGIKKRRVLFFFFFGILLLLGVFFLRPNSSVNGTLSEPIKRGKIIESVYGIGTVTATKSYALKYGVSATIQKLYVKEGDHVNAGDKLVEMLDGNTFKAPFSGTVTSLPVKVGENVLSQSIILNLVSLEDRYITVSLEQQSAILVRPGQKARLSFDGLRKESYEGTVESVYSNDNNFLVRIGGANLPPQILPGMTADVAVSLNEHNNVLLVPIAAIDNGNVHVMNKKKLKTVAIKTGVVDGAIAEITAGDLHEGERLLIRKMKT